jgi:hypothetical protein
MQTESPTSAKGGNVPTNPESMIAMHESFADLGLAQCSGESAASAWTSSTSSPTGSDPCCSVSRGPC